MATALNVSDSQISQWLSGTRNPTAATKAALHYYFQSIELNQLKNRNDILKLSTMQYVAVKAPVTGKQYTILWNHYDRNLVVNKSEIDEIKYVDLSRYRYLLLNPDDDHYNILYEFNTEDELRLIRKAKADFAHDFEVVYGYDRKS